MKKSIFKRWWFWVVVVIIVIAAALPKGEDKPAAEEAATKSTTVKATEATVEKTWQEVITFKGNSIKDTQKFDIESDEWRIKWSTAPGELGDMNFQIFLYDGKGNLEGVLANIVGKGSDESYGHQAGTYYFTINTAQNYEIVVEQYK